MPEPTPPIAAEPDPGPRPVRHLEFKAALLLLFTVALIAGSVLYLLYARGVFEPTQRLVLVADAAGLAVFTVAGTELAVASGTSGPVAVLLGIITGTGGGVAVGDRA